MKLTIKQIAEAFSNHNFEAIYPFIADNILWNMVGAEQITGKENVVKTCEQSANYLKSVETKFNKFIVIESINYTVIDSSADYIDKDKNISRIASCDIYKFNSGQLVEITSYTVELDK
jgi:limonene-1,2-epoxide hydrolase